MRNPAAGQTMQVGRPKNYRQRSFGLKQHLQDPDLAEPPHLTILDNGSLLPQSLATDGARRLVAPSELVVVYSLPGKQVTGRAPAADRMASKDGGDLTNERTTEEIVRDHFRRYGTPGQLFEEQTSGVPRVQAALREASKAGTGAGKPEFIVTFPDDAPGLVIVVECKANPKLHQSAAGDKPAMYAVDGVLHYSKHLAKKFDVISIAASGTKAKSLTVSTFRQLKGELKAEPLPSPAGPVNQLIPVADYRSLLDYDPAVRARTQAQLMGFSRQLHNYMRDYAKLSEAEKPLIVSGILLALRDDAFNRTWPKLKPSDLARELATAIERTARAADFRETKREIMLAPYAFIRTHPELSRPASNGETPLYRLIEDIEVHVSPFLNTYHDVDVIGQFYGEFLRYTGGDKKGLGIVLTPRHVTELFARIANVGINDVVLDTCAGTGGFLIASMVLMDEKAGVDAGARERIRRHQLIGVEQQPHMFALAASNMILRGDGKANLYQGSCFAPKTVDELTKGVRQQHARPTVGLINPPFSQKGDGLHELEFVENLLNILAPGGTAVVVVPMSCAIESHPVRTRLLATHTLKAVMSLPNDLFHPVGVITCAMVFQAHQPNSEAMQPTWFGYWKSDGFVKTKDRGRIDLNGTWSARQQEWLTDYHGRVVTAGRSVTAFVTAQDEWCAEAYMETDYSALHKGDFEAILRKYAVFQLMNPAMPGDDETPEPENQG